MKKKLILICLMIIFLSFVSAQPPFQEASSTVGLDIRFPQTDIVKQNRDLNYNIHVFNKSDGLLVTNETVSCKVHLFNSTGSHVLNLDLPFDLDSGDFNLFVNGGNFSTVQRMSAITQCNSSTEGGFVSFGFQVTPNGEEPTEAKAIFYIGLLFLLVVFLTIAIYGFISSDVIWQRAAGISAIYLFLIAISFLSWNMAADFLTSSTFLIAFLRIIFFVLIIGFFPFLISLFAYGVWMMITTEEIERMMEKGVSYDEAASRVKSKRKNKW